MYDFLHSTHSIWAYLVLALLLVAVINSIAGFVSKREFKKSDRMMGLLGLVATHLQLVFGLLLYLNSPMGLEALGEMKNAELRLTSLEHPLINIIGIILITVGWSRHKKAADSQEKFRSIWLMYGIGLVLLLSRIPYNMWFS